MLAKFVSTLKLSALLFLLSLSLSTVAFAEDEEAPSEEAPGDEVPGDEAPAEEAPAEEEKTAPVNGTVGGFGLIGGHFGQALTADGGIGQWFDFGGGVEVGLASKKGRLAGRVRFAYFGSLQPDQTVRNNGVLSAGISVQLLKDVHRKFGAYALLDVGVSPLVTELRVFVFADVGAGVRYRPVERLELFAEVTALLRFEKAISVGPLAFVGARFRL
jgi:hypothetical protein